MPAMMKAILLLLPRLLLILPLAEALTTRKPLRQRPTKQKLLFEHELRKKYQYIIGSDESGKGCIAGPVVCASCCLLNYSNVIVEVDDSKRLTREARREIYQTITSQPDQYVWAVETRSSEVIDQIGLEQATKECFFDTITSVVQKIQQRNLKATEGDFYSIVDGHSSIKLPITSRPWKGGDEMVYTVALASIIARYHHEQIMLDLASEFPNYLFDQHGGYPTRDHIQALHTHGSSAVHRQTCKPVQQR